MTGIMPTQEICQAMWESRFKHFEAPDFMVDARY